MQTFYRQNCWSALTSVVNWLISTWPLLSGSECVDTRGVAQVVVVEWAATKTSMVEMKALILKKTWAQVGEEEEDHVVGHQEEVKPFPFTCPSAHLASIKTEVSGLNMTSFLGGVGRKGLLPTPDDYPCHYEGGRNQEGWEGGRDSGRSAWRGCQ